MARNYFAICTVWLTLLLPVLCFRTYTKDDILRLREEVREMFQHAYDGYLKYAGNYDELRPLSCDGVDTWGSYSLTLIDALDTLAVMGNYSEFRRVVDIITQKTNYDADINVSVFETNIRIVGGLLGAHLMSLRAGVDVEPGWPCNGPLLRLAEDVAKRLLPAFDTKTGMPYGTVNLRHGVPSGETTVTCTAGVGTFIVEFGALSRLTGDPIYEEVALNALYALWRHRSPIGLFGNHIDVQTGRWTAQDAGIGAGVDSYYEYLVKGALMLNRPELLEMFHTGRKAIDKYLKRDDWHVWVSMNKGQVTLPVFQSLEAYWPGVLSLIGDIGPAMKTLHNYHSVWKQYGFLPEFYNIQSAEAGANRENYPLRPELIESVMYLYRATSDPYLLEVGEDMLRSIQYSAKTSCGYATIKNVRDHRKEDRMESFFLAETTKYLYLLFDPENFLHNDGREGTLHETPNGICVIHAGGYIFNTEAHPIDPSALRCCHDNSDWFKDYKVEKFLGEELKKREERDYTSKCSSDMPKLGNIENLTVDIETSSLDSKDLVKNLKKHEEKITILKQLKNESYDKTPMINTLNNIIKNSGGYKGILKETVATEQVLEKILATLEPAIKMNEKIFASEAHMIDLVSAFEKVIDRFVQKNNITIKDITKDVNRTLLDTEASESLPRYKQWLENYENIAVIIYIFNTLKSLHSLQKLQVESSRYDVLREAANLLDSLRSGEDESTLKSDYPELMAIFISSQENYEKLLAGKNLTLAISKYANYLLADEPLEAPIEKIATITEILKEKKQHFENTDKVKNPLNLKLLENIYNLLPKVDEFDENKESMSKLERPTKVEKAKFETIKPQQSDDIILVDESSKNSNKNISDTRPIKENSIHKDEHELDNEPNIGKGYVEPVSLNEEEESLTMSNSKSEYQSAESAYSTDNILPAIQQYIEDTTNNSLLSDFVQTILKSALPAKPKFEPQLLLEKIRANGIYNNQRQNFELLTCRAQPFLQRVSINGEFF